MKNTSHQHDLTRPRQWFAVFLALGGRTALVGAVVCLAVTIWSWSAYRTASLFERDGIVTTATIVSRRHVMSQEDTDVFYLTYRFPAAGMIIERERKVTAPQFRAAQTDTSPTIRYLLTTPQRFETFVGQEAQSALVLQLIAACAGLAALGVLWWTGSAANRAVLTRKYGYRTMATVTPPITAGRGSANSERFLFWKTDDGTTGQSFRRPAHQLPHLRPGSEIAVYVRKGHSVWEGDVGPQSRRDDALPESPRKRT